MPILHLRYRGMNHTASYFLLRAPRNTFLWLMEMRKVEEAPTQKTKECPECLSKIPSDARRCAFCTTVLVPDALTAGAGAAAGSGQPAVAQVDRTR